MPRLRFLRPSTGLGLEKRGIHFQIWSFIGRFYCLRLFAWLLPALISASFSRRPLITKPQTTVKYSLIFSSAQWIYCLLIYLIPQNCFELIFFCSIRPCLKNGGMPDWGRFFCQARRFDAGILTDFKSNQRSPGGKRCPKTAFCHFSNKA